MDYMKDWMEAQKKMAEEFQKGYAQFMNQQAEAKNPMSELLDMQKKLMDALSTNPNPFEAYQKVMENPAFNMDAYKSFVDMQKAYFDSFEKMKAFYPKNMKAFDFSAFDAKNVNEAFKKYQDAFQSYDLGKFFDPQMKGLLDKMSNANAFYLQMYDFWNKINRDLTSTFAEDTAKLEEYIKNTADSSFDMLLSAMPDEFKPYLSEPRELAAKYFDSISNFYAPWKGEIDNLRDLFVYGVLDSDPEKLTDFFQIWKERYNETFGKIVNSPTFGLSRNMQEQQNKAMDRFIDMFIVASEFTAKINAVQSDAFKNIIEEYMAMVNEGKEIKSFEEFFGFWSKKMDDKLVSYFGTEEFTKLLAEFGSAAMDFKLESNRLLEQYLSDSPIVTEGQLDSMIKSLYEVKKELKAVKKELEALKAQQASTSAAPEAK